MREAYLYERLPKNLIHCFLCSHHCKISQGGFGFCGVRENINGKLFTHAYGKVIAAHIDPIEKKPLYHFFPGTLSFSIATIGCNFRCGFCQNWQISQANYRDNKFEEQDFSSRKIVETAINSNCKSISYTYTEPTIFFEYALDTAKIAKERGLYNIFVTNGYMTKECIEMASPYLDAANIDLKFFRESSYKKICKGSLQPVLDSIRLMHDLGVWVEVTTLVVPGENDSQDELKEIANFIASIDKNIPWHISAFHPDYNFSSKNITPEEKIKEAQEIGSLSGLHYVYAGNISGRGNDTYCYTCRKALIRRRNFLILENNLKSGACPACTKPLDGKF